MMRLYFIFFSNGNNEPGFKIRRQLVQRHRQCGLHHPALKIRLAALDPHQSNSVNHSCTNASISLFSYSGHIGLNQLCVEIALTAKQANKSSNPTKATENSRKTQATKLAFNKTHDYFDLAGCDRPLDTETMDISLWPVLNVRSLKRIAKTRKHQLEIA